MKINQASRLTSYNTRGGGKSAVAVVHPSAGVRILIALIWLVALLSLLSSEASAAVISVIPNTWDTIGLDSNSPTAGPYVFPVGARITGTPNTAGSATLVWDTGGTTNTDEYIRIRNNQTLNFTFDSSGKADVYFEVEIAKKDATAYNQTRRYHISSGGVNSVTRELFIEHLISQGRNAITDMKVGTTEANLVSVPNGGSMSLITGNSYYIQLVGYTATSGYEQLEAFINFDNTVIQILSVKATGTAASPITSPSDYLYADACSWEADPDSLDYRACRGSGKFGGDITVTYHIKVLSVGSGSQQLNSLIHDFSGSSFHYNADYSTTARTMYLVDPANATMAKSFSPNPTSPATGSTLSFTLTNPNPGAISGLNFIDDFTTVAVTPAGGTLRVAATPAVTNTCGGTVTDLGGVNPPAANGTGIMLTGGTIAGNSSCTIQVNVTPSSGTVAGTTYANTAGNLKVRLSDGTNVNTNSPLATATLTAYVTNPPPPPSSTCATPVELARWTFDGSDYNNNALPSAGTTISSGSYQYASSKLPDVSYARARALYGSATAGGIANATTTPWGGCTTGCNAGKPYPNSADATNSWGYIGGWPATAPLAATQPVFEFELDTSNYGGIGLATDYNLEANWSNGDLWYLWGSADGSSWTQLNTMANSWNAANKGAWTKGGIFSNTTLAYAKYFRIQVAGAQYSGGASSTTGATVYLDNIKIIGCPRLKTPVILKHFSPNPILANGVSKLVFTVTNPNLDADLTATSFTDDFTTAVVTPAGGNLRVAAPPSVTNSCTTGTVTDLGGINPPTSGSTGIKVVGATVPKGGSCTVTVDVTASAIGTYQNTVTVFDTNAGASHTNSSSDTLTVNAPNPAVSIFKEVATSTAAPLPESSLWRNEIVVKKDAKIYYQFTVQNDGDVQLRDVQATDPAFPDLATCNGAGWKYGDGVTTVPLDGSNRMTLEVASNSDLVYKDFATCIIGGATVIPALNGTVTNTALVAATYNSIPLSFDAVFMQDTAKYHGFIPPTAAKSFGSGSIGVGETTTLTLTLGNPSTNPGTLNGLKMDDTFPSGMTLKDTAFTFIPAGCGTVSKTDDTAPAAGDGAIRFKSAAIAANGSCQVQLNITSSADGAVTNTTGTPTASGVLVAGRAATLDLAGAAASAPLTVTALLPSLTVIKYVRPYWDPVNLFGPAPPPKPIPGAIMIYTIKIMNSGPGVVDSGTLRISDPIPDNAVLCVTNSCSNPPVERILCTSCGLTVDFPADVAFSNRPGGVGPYDYNTLSPDAEGYDTNVTGIEINPKGILGAAPADFEVTFKVKIK